MNKKLEKIKTEFETNGYYILRNFCKPKSCNNFLTLISKYASDEYEPIMNPDRVEFLLSQTTKKFDNFKNLRQKTYFFEELVKDAEKIKKFMFNDKLLKILKFIKGKKVDPLMSQMIFKKAKTRFSKQSWHPHQDNSYPKNTNNEYITTNIFKYE